VSPTVPTGLDAESLELTLEPIDEFAQPELPDSVALQPGANAQQTASPRREAAASPSAAAPAPARVGRDAPAPIRAAIGS
jgi:hypothetical protein